MRAIHTGVWLSPIHTKNGESPDPYLGDQTVEQSLTSVTSSKSSEFDLSLQLTPHLCIFILTAVSLTIIFGTRMAAQSMPSASSPMKAYTGVFPGQPRSAVDAYGFSCSVMESYADGRPTMESCLLSPAEGDVSSVEVIVSDNFIALIRFIYSESAVRLGDIMLLLGRPKVHRNGEQMYFTWYDSGVMATSNHLIADKRHTSPTLSLYWISFSDTRILSSLN